MGMKVTPEMYNQLPSNPVEMLLVTFDGQDEIAAFCSISPQAVWNWKWRDAIPKSYVEDLSKYTGIPTWMLCPKHFHKGESVADSFEYGEQGDGEDRGIKKEGGE